MNIYYILLAAGLVLQLLSGNINPELFGFPVNLLVIAVIIYAAFADDRKARKKNRLPRISTSKNIIIAIASVVAAGIIIMVVPQFPEDIATRAAIGRRLGLFSFTTSWIFGAVMVWFLIVLAATAMKFAGRGVGRKSISFAVVIAGIWLSLVSLYIGGSDTTDVKVAAFSQFSTNMGNSKGQYINMPIMVKMEDLTLEPGRDGEIKRFYATVEVTSETGAKALSLDSKKPAKYGKQRVYLLDYDHQAGGSSNYCIVRFLHRPWMPVAITGILIMLAGGIMFFMAGKKEAAGNEQGKK